MVYYLVNGKLFLYQISDGDKPVRGSSANGHQSLGSAGLALHYANIITQIDTLVSSYILTSTVSAHMLIVKYFVPSLLFGCFGKLNFFTFVEK